MYPLFAVLNLKYTSATNPSISDPKLWFTVDQPLVGVVIIIGYCYYVGAIKLSAYALFTASVERVGVARLMILLEFIFTEALVKFVEAMLLSVLFVGRPPELRST